MQGNLKVQEVESCNGDCAGTMENTAVEGLASGHQEIKLSPSNKKAAHLQFHDC